MRGSGRKASLALLATLAIAVAASGCGGGSKASSAGAESTSSSSPSSSTTQPASSTTASQTPTTSTTSTSSVHTPSQQGEASYEREVKSPSYVDPSITKYGKDANSGEAAEVGELVNTYYREISSHEDAKACALLTPRLKLVVLAPLARSGSPQVKGKGCPVILPALLGVSGNAIPRPSDVHIKTVRLQGGNGFVIVKTPALPAGVMHVQKINGKWMMGTPIAVPAP